MAKKKLQQTASDKSFSEALIYLDEHPMFSRMFYSTYIHREHGYNVSNQSYAFVTQNGHIYCHPTKNLSKEEWIYVLAHCMLHLGLEHFKKMEHPAFWNIACDVSIARFLYDMKIGRAPNGMTPPTDHFSKDEHALYKHFVAHGNVEPQYIGWGTSGQNEQDLFLEDEGYFGYKNWGFLLAEGIADAVSRAVDVASGVATSFSGKNTEKSAAEQAKSWFISSFPLLGSLASTFTIVYDLRTCQSLDISIAAIDVKNQEIFINPAANLSMQELRFVMAHELLHAGLCHHERRQGRDSYYWNVACDYVINGWLVDMNIGEMPEIGALYDPELKGLSAETIYDTIVANLRVYRKLYTFRGREGKDLIDDGTVDFWKMRDGLTLEEFYKNCLAQGLEYHIGQGRGFLPAGLIEEIQALSMPPIRWDVELAKWFDQYFQPIEKRRTFSRLSRRQASTPHIPRPSYSIPEDELEGRTFAVVLDTSGSMDKKLLAKALGTIASYSTAREVVAVRVIFCDAAAYDVGYMRVEDIASSVKIKGRGGTILQPAIDLIQKAEDFPKDGPILIITDGGTDRLRISNPHAFVLPKGRRLPFIAKGEIFYID
ncbi:peptidase [[Bacillus] sp. KCTC 13219]|nr:peptidase [[Bacillus] sp. KCTC 13219]